MSKATQCRFFGHIITIEKALAVRDAATPGNKHKLLFECSKCGTPVRPHIGGDKCAAHFRHIHRNPECHFTDPPRDF